MKKIQIKTTYKKMLSDVYTPVGIYLRLRDRFRDTVLWKALITMRWKTVFLLLA
jgi:hypothetical protein